jgi:lysophospholipid acyltransferase (LPLAT)-like uncharacterized protein
MQHPAAYMKPVHVALHLMGIGVILGSGGEEGRQAADLLEESVREGFSTAISPDGPRGPSGLLKKGVLHIALKSGVPILPVRLATSRGIVLPSWDKKLVPLPFSTIRVFIEEPLTVTEGNLEEVAEVLTERMTGPTGAAPTRGRA